MTDIFQYTPGNTVIHKLNPITKLFLAIAICIAAFLSDSLVYLLALLAVDVLIGLLGGVPRKTLSILKGLFKASVFLFILQILVIRSGQPVLGFITDEGIMTATKVVLRLMIACLPLALILAVTQISAISNALVQVLHLPYPYAFAVTTAVRFVPQFMEEMSGIMEAQKARGVEFDTKNIFKKIGMIIPLCAPLLISSVRRSDATAAAAEVRGFDLRTRESGFKHYPFKAADLITFLIAILLIAGGALF